MSRWVCCWEGLSAAISQAVPGRAPSSCDQNVPGVSPLGCCGALGRERCELVSMVIGLEHDEDFGRVQIPCGEFKWGVLINLKSSCREIRDEGD